MDIGFVYIELIAQQADIHSSSHNTNRFKTETVIRVMRKRCVMSEIIRADLVRRSGKDLLRSRQLS